MISQKTVTHKDKTMRVSRHSGTHTTNLSSAAVEVSNIPRGFRRDKLTMLFENTKRSGGGLIEKLDFVPDSGRAVITFTDAAGKHLSPNTV